MAVRRREFLGLCGTFLSRACLPVALASCRHNDDDDGFDRFPFGVASGDPRSTSVVLWTCVAPINIGAPAIVSVEMALDPEFMTGVLNDSYEVTSASDYTLRVIVEDLEPDTIYYDRFSAGQKRSTVGRTWTAPPATAAEPIRFAFVSCQDRTHGYGVAVVSESVMAVDLVTVDDYNRDHGPEGPPIRSVASFTVPYTAPGQTASIDGPVFTGTPPFPFYVSPT